MRKLATGSGTNLSGVSEHNRRVILQALRLNGSMTRAEIARSTKLVPQTVSNLIEALKADGFVCSTGTIKGKRGQPATPYRIAKNGAFSLGIHIDKYGARAVALNLLGGIVCKHEAGFRLDGLKANLPTIRELLARTMDGLPLDGDGNPPEIFGVGLAMPAATGIHGGSDDPWMCAPRDAHPMLAALEGMTGKPVSLHHDAVAAASAERLNGAAIGVDNFVYVFIGYGLGAGIYVNGAPVNGYGHFAGEIGQIPVLDGNKPVRLEHIASLSALCDRLGLDLNDAFLMQRLEAAMESQPAIVNDWLTSAATQLSWLVDMVECLIDPQFVVFGGSIPAPLLRRLCSLIDAIGAATPALSGLVRPQLLPSFIGEYSVASGAAAFHLAMALDPSISAIAKPI